MSVRQRYRTSRAPVSSLNAGFFPVQKVGAMSIAILCQPIKPRRQAGDCGRRIRISVCSPSLHDKTSKPQIQQQGAQGDLRGTFCCSACYVLPATHPEREPPSWSLSLWSAEHRHYKSQTSCLATLEGVKRVVLRLFWISFSSCTVLQNLDPNLIHFSAAQSEHQ